MLIKAGTAFLVIGNDIYRTQKDVFTTREEAEEFLRPKVIQLDKVYRWRVINKDLNHDLAARRFTAVMIGENEAVFRMKGKSQELFVLPKRYLADGTIELAE